MIYLVAYDREPMRANPAFLTALAENVNSYRKFMRGVWIVESDAATADDLSGPLCRAATRADNVLVIRVVDDFAGWMEGATVDWLNKMSSRLAFDAHRRRTSEHEIGTETSP